MKTLRFFIFAFGACLAFVPGMRAQTYHWKVTHPSTIGPFEYAFTAIDSWGEVIAAAGTRKNDTLSSGGKYALIICRSTDGGATWTEQDAGLPHFGRTGEFAFQKIQQIDSLTAVAIDDSELVRTTNGGMTWTKQSLPPTGALNDFDFSDPMTGIVTGLDSSDIMTTIDGGSHWILAPFHPWSPAYFCHSYGDGHFIVSLYGGAGVYETHDDWGTYDSLPWIVPAAEKEDVIGGGSWRFAGTDTIVAFGVHGSGFLTLIETSTDGGGSWTKANVADSVINPPWSMSSLDRSIVFCTGGSQYPHLLSSSDHGMSWRVDTLEVDTTYFPQIIPGVIVTPSGRAVALYGLFQTALILGTPANDGVSRFVAEEPVFEMYPNPATPPHNNFISIWQAC